MPRRVLESVSCLLAIGVLAGGCGSSEARSNGDAAEGGGGGAGGRADGGSACVAEEPAGGVTSWTDDGLSRCALIIQTSRTSGTASDNFELIAVDPGSVGLTLSVSSYGGALGGTYGCQPDGGPTAVDGGASAYVSFQYSGGGATYTTEDCDITITAAGAPGENARGTFSATLAPLGGGSSKAIAGGVFDTPVAVTGG